MLISIGYVQLTDLYPFENNYSYVKLPNKLIMGKKNRSYSFLVSLDRLLLYN